ncbi:unnamed protein product [Caenorhabditis auriculariae]|uniref:Uncharacterized protein n=1 Tax=Caenorhabditis auriculariae TaxID=2777116 RepID=A0A8S1H135_9PELO|nr:unnamed protein product [Caenorhabditis auriculariae]
MCGSVHFHGPLTDVDDLTRQYFSKERGEMQGHVARRAVLDQMMSTSTASGTTPRSSSWSRENPSDSARAPRSKSMGRPKAKEAEEEEKERRENAEAAFREWLKRKAVEPRTPRASPTRAQISKHLKDEAKQRVINQWHNDKRFQRPATSESVENGSSS